ncbi:hypothetical protein SAMN04488498_1484 [Mesorhizobium albiziae]|uniref:Uncharacterized protein n=1 Tax=Neomesorhizobium albiziae TaxID=335020 RepID=A0A1I4FI40_9HYPH|nr:hypothetical protein [Mesorhizobium albiziae]GLS32600.1 hypothetical protein GCM10007937_43100 [Mesorhizobium albiziae]SFL17625.1 hypothetical protein SAMN04488498_1484 [Mesorhizobium albiziae]
MTSKKAANDKRAALPWACDYTKGFLKDWERLPAPTMKQLKEAMMLFVANDEPLGRGGSTIR